jgi:23S rRNA (uracil1939-C5)-methyltransferase
VTQEIEIIAGGEPVILPKGPRRGDTLTITVQRLDEKGTGVATFPAKIGPQEMPRTYKATVRKAIPGDRVRLFIEKSRKKELTCRVDELIDPSPSRIAPRCQHFGWREEAGKGCGGCSLQSMGYQDQLTFKHETIRRLFENAGLERELVLEPVGVDEPWYYRNKMEFSFGDNPQHDFALGFHPLGYRHDVLALQECHLQSEFTSSFLPAYSAAVKELGIPMYSMRTGEGFLKNLVLREGKRTGEHLIEVVTSSLDQTILRGSEVEAREAAEVLCSLAGEVAATFGVTWDSVYWTRHHVKTGERTTFTPILIEGKPTLTEQMHLPGGHKLSFEVHPRAFFQPNTLQAERIYAKVLAYTGLMSEDEDAPKVVLDLYCGTGTIGLCMAPYAGKVVGVELNADAIENARENAANNAIENASFFVGDVGEVMASEAFRAEVGEKVELVVVDPPRAGLFPAAIDQISALAPARLVYVSCNPKSLARDLALLVERGYRVAEVQPLDMFPQTYHVENVALLDRII